MPDENVQTQADAWLAEPLRTTATPDEQLRNAGNETPLECADRMLREHECDRREKYTARAAARMTAEGIATSWRTVGHESMATFYGRVAAMLSED